MPTRNLEGEKSSTNATKPPSLYKTTLPNQTQLPSQSQQTQLLPTGAISLTVAPTIGGRICALFPHLAQQPGKYAKF